MTSERALTLAEQEQEANIFAMCILMPEELLRPAFEKLSKRTNDEDVILVTLARKFQVPVFAMSQRLNMMGLLNLTGQLDLNLNTGDTDG